MANTVNIEKVKVIASYLADKINNLYVTKLMKLFYYIDFISYAERGAPVTNDIYYKLPYGPVPSLIKNEIDILSGNVMEEGAKSQLSNNIKLEDGKGGYGKLVVNMNKNYDLKVLSEFELELTDYVIKKIGRKSASYLTNKTHDEKPYTLTNENAVISYKLAEVLGGREVLVS